MHQPTLKSLLQFLWTIPGANCLGSWELNPEERLLAGCRYWGIYQTTPIRKWGCQDLGRREIKLQGRCHRDFRNPRWGVCWCWPGPSELFQIEAKVQGFVALHWVWTGPGKEVARQHPLARSGIPPQWHYCILDQIIPCWLGRAVLCIGRRLQPSCSTYQMPVAFSPPPVNQKSLQTAAHVS